MGESNLPSTIGGKYRPVRLIGQGGMGAVYEVIHVNTGEHLALKVMLARTQLTPDLVERFKREARAATAVKSEHVVRVTDADVAQELNGAPFLVMDLLAGQDLERLCEKRRPATAEVVDWLRQVARGLDKAHRLGVVHRDLKPENLFLAEREDLPPVVKILDFGIAKMSQEGGHATSSGRIMGTPRYMAPEQTNDAREVSASADRFALGLISFRLLCGRHYFDEENTMKLLLQVSRGPSVPPSALGSSFGDAFDAWFATACSPDPRKRFSSCIEQVDALATALGLPAQSARVSDPSGPPQVSSDSAPASEAIESAPTLSASMVTHSGSVARPGRRILAWIGVAVVILAGVGAAAFWGNGRADVERPRAAASGAESTPPTSASSSILPVSIPLDQAQSATIPSLATPPPIESAAGTAARSAPSVPSATKPAKVAASAEHPKQLPKHSPPPAATDPFAEPK